jgi:predicted lipoprotein with Yx(FWY)xxD motif
MMGAAGAALAAAAGCGGGGSGGSGGSNYGGGSSTTSAAPTGGTSGQTIKTASVGNLGPILVDGAGRTVYLFEKDKGNESSCSGSCAAVWPPVTTSVKPRPGSGADASKLNTTKRSDGTTEVSYAGHPLYYYAPDGTSGGSTGGQGLDQFGAKWYVLSPSGSAVTK